MEGSRGTIEIVIICQKKHHLSLRRSLGESACPNEAVDYAEGICKE